MARYSSHCGVPSSPPGTCKQRIKSIVVGHFEHHRSSSEDPCGSYGSMEFESSFCLEDGMLSICGSPQHNIEIQEGGELALQRSAAGEIHRVPSEHVTLSNDATITGSNGSSRVVGVPLPPATTTSLMNNNRRNKTPKRGGDIVGVHRLWLMEERSGGEKERFTVRAVISWTLEHDPFTSTRKTRASSSRDPPNPKSSTKTLPPTKTLSKLSIETQEKFKPKSSTKTQAKSKHKPSNMRNKNEQELVDVIISNYNPDGDYFEFGGKPITLAAEDVALIIGRKRVMPG
ncbi:hypothetical protein QJS04_geneDACA022788 [Acorus gramineus]|uniref:Uncharacterized protein n=1 Tax=Acorus gramineus TaxID=55184 RepID=A0AAV9B8H3_ACOGR|nr:hypothetical protein QJS04_geneDACA022788 [Acorus gramineus]